MKERKKTPLFLKQKTKILALSFMIFLLPCKSLFAQEENQDENIINSAESKEEENLQEENFYTIENLIFSMQHNNPDLLKIQEEYARSLLDVKDAIAGLGPSIDLEVYGIYMANPPLDSVYLNLDDVINSIQWPSGIAPSSTGQYVKIYDGMENTFYNFQLTLTQPLFTWGKLTDSVKIYRQVSDIKQIQLKSKTDQMTSELETRVTALHYLSKINKIIEEEKEYAERLVKTSEDAETNGMLLHQAVVDARIQAKELDIACLDLNEQITNQMLELKRMTGLQDLTLEKVDLAFDESSLSEILEQDFEQVEKDALSAEQSSLKMLNLLKEVSLGAEKIARASENWKPDFALKMTTSYGGSRLPLLEENYLRKDDYTFNVTVGMQAKIWDGGKKLNDISRKISEVNTADINLNDALSSIKKSLNNQWTAGHVCTMKMEYQDLKIESALSNIKQKEDLFNTGYGAESDVLNAKITWCNERIEKEKQALSRAQACYTIKYLQGK